MALTVNYLPRYKGLSGSHPQLQNSGLIDDGTTLSTTRAFTSLARNIKVVEATTTYVVATTDELIVCNAPITTFTVTLPVASGSGRYIVVKNINQGTAEVTPNGTDTIDGINSAAVVSYKGSVKLVDYAANKWVVIY